MTDAVGLPESDKTNVVFCRKIRFEWFCVSPAFPILAYPRDFSVGG
jgi:hypothetical protein